MLPWRRYLRPSSSVDHGLGDVVHAGGVYRCFPLAEMYQGALCSRRMQCLLQRRNRTEFRVVWGRVASDSGLLLRKRT